jgi:hypothetical protein
MECASPPISPPVTPISRPISREQEVEVSSNPDGEQEGQEVLLVESQIQIPKKKRGGDDDLLGRLEVKKKKTAIEKLETILQLGDGLKQTGEYTENARNFINKTILPVQNCFKNHHNSDKSSFLAKWGKQFPYSRFREKCKGLLGSTCNE